MDGSTDTDVRCGQSTLPDRRSAVGCRRNVCVGFRIALPRVALARHRVCQASASAWAAAATVRASDRIAAPVASSAPPSPARRACRLPEDETEAELPESVSSCSPCSRRLSVGRSVGQSDLSVPDVTRHPRVGPVGLARPPDLPGPCGVILPCGRCCRRRRAATFICAVFTCRMTRV
jgi:hypothetical protein